MAREPRIWHFCARVGRTPTRPMRNAAAPAGAFGEGQRLRDRSVLSELVTVQALRRWPRSRTLADLGVK